MYNVNIVGVVWVDLVDKYIVTYKKICLNVIWELCAATAYVCIMVNVNFYAGSL